MIQRTNILQANAYNLPQSTQEIIVTMHYNNELVFQGPVNATNRPATDNEDKFDRVCSWITDVDVAGFIPVKIHVINGNLVIKNIIMNHVRGSVPGQFYESPEAYWHTTKPEDFRKFVDDRFNLTDCEFENQYMITKEQAEKNVKWVATELPDDVFIRPSSGQFGNDGKFNLRLNGKPVIGRGEKYVKTILGDGHHHIPNNSTLEFDYMVSPLNVEQYMAGPPVRL